MGSKTWDRVEQRLECLRALSRRSDLDLRESFLLGRVVQTYLQLEERDAERFNRELAESGNKEVREMVVTWDEAQAEREQQGMRQGRTEGKLQATREAILLLAGKRRDLAVPEDFAARLDAVEDLDRLHDALERLFDVRSIDELGF